MLFLFDSCFDTNSSLSNIYSLPIMNFCTSCDHQNLSLLTSFRSVWPNYATGVWEHLVFALKTWPNSLLHKCNPGEITLPNHATNQGLAFMLPISALLSCYQSVPCFHALNIFICNLCHITSLLVKQVWTKYICYKSNSLCPLHYL